MTDENRPSIHLTYGGKSLGYFATHGEVEAVLHDHLATLDPPLHLREDAVFEIYCYDEEEKKDETKMIRYVCDHDGGLLLYDPLWEPHSRLGQVCRSADVEKLEAENTRLCATVEHLENKIKLWNLAGGASHK